MFEFRRTVMQTLAKVMVFGVGLLISGTALAADYYSGSLPYNQYYTESPYNYPGYSYAYGYPAYGWPAYGWYAGAPYPWPQLYGDPSATWHPYSRTNPNWMPYAGWR